MDKHVQLLRSYLLYPEVVRLLNCSQGEDGTNSDRHSQHVFAGFNLLNEYEGGLNNTTLKEAVRLFNRIQSSDKKYLQALALYGMAVAYGMADMYKEALTAIKKLKKLRTSWSTDYLEDIEDLQHYACKEMAEDLHLEHKRLHPNEKENKGCLSVILLLIISSTYLII